jgi:hypothetical protein
MNNHNDQLNEPAKRFIFHRTAAQVRKRIALHEAAKPAWMRHRDGVRAGTIARKTPARKSEKAVRNGK